MTIFFPDISGYQAGIDLAGALVVIAKATEGTGYTNPEFGAFKAEAARSGTFFAAYHFLSAGAAAAQAAHCHTVAGDTPVMLDFEPSISRPGMGDARAFIDAYRKLGGRCWLVYLPRWYWQQLGSPSLGAMKRRGMRLVSSNYSGAYTDNPAGPGWLPYGGMTPTVWQYSSTTPFHRQKVDFNAFRGSAYAGKQDPASVAACLAEFKSLARTGRWPTEAAPKLDAYRHEVATGLKESLPDLARRRNVTVDALVTFSLSRLSDGNDAILTSYVALGKALRAQGHPWPPMPEGLIYWTHNA